MRRGRGAHHADVLRAALWAVGPAPGVRTVSSAFYMVLRAGDGAPTRTRRATPRLRGC
jgi:phosphotransacetylase